MLNKKVNIAIAGLGNVGDYFYRNLNKCKKLIEAKTGKIIIIKYLSVKNPKKKRFFKIPKKKLVINSVDLAFKKDIDIIVELIGGSDGAAKKLVFCALKNGKHVITANKALISKHGDELSSLAELNNVNLEYEASVAGGIPVIKTIKQGLIANKISKIYGILNGTTNYILSEMEKSNKSFSTVLNDAKQLGFAENNPISDINGNDAAAKIRILSSLAFGNKISKNKILIEGIQNINLIDIFHARKLGYKIKLLSISEFKDKKLVERVHPCLLLKNSHIAHVNGVLNAVIIDGTPVGRTILQGEGAGPGPTTSALISGLYNVLNDNITYPFAIPSNLRKKVKKFNVLNLVCSSYFRIEVKDQPGVLSSITKLFKKNKISIKNLIQNPNKKNKKASLVIITHNSIEKNFKDLLMNLSKNKYVLSKPTFIRIEKI